MLRSSSLFQQCLGVFEHGMKHLGGETARLSIVAAAVIGIEQPQTIRKFMQPVMTKGELGLLHPHRFEHRIVGDRTQRNHHRPCRQGLQLLAQEGVG